MKSRSHSFQFQFHSCIPSLLCKKFHTSKNIIISQNDQDFIRNPLPFSSLPLPGKVLVIKIIKLNVGKPDKCDDNRQRPINSQLSYVHGIIAPLHTNQPAPQPKRKTPLIQFANVDTIMSQKHLKLIFHQRKNLKEKMDSKSVKMTQSMCSMHNQESNAHAEKNILEKFAINADRLTNIVIADLPHTKIRNQ
jgi:hypothetical protein